MRSGYTTCRPHCVAAARMVPATAAARDAMQRSATTSLPLLSHSCAAARLWRQTSQVPLARLCQTSAPVQACSLSEARTRLSEVRQLCRKPDVINSCVQLRIACEASLAGKDEAASCAVLCEQELCLPACHGMAQVAQGVAILVPRRATTALAGQPCSAVSHKVL